MVEKLKFIKVEIPMTGMVVDVLAKDLKEMDNKTVSLDLTRQLKGRGLDAVFQFMSRMTSLLQNLSGLPFSDFTSEE